MTLRVRLLVADVDGTLVTTEKALTPASLTAAAALREAGVALALVSSRPPRGMAGIAAQLGPHIPLAGFNGGNILDADGRVLSERLLPIAMGNAPPAVQAHAAAVTLSNDEDAARAALAGFAKFSVDAWVFADGEWLLRNPEGDYVPLERRTIGFEPYVVDDFTAYAGRAGKLVGASRDHVRLEKCEAALQRDLGAQATVHRSQAYYLDVTHREADKGHALLTLAALLGIDPGEVACIGDMPNDLPMFSVAGLAADGFAAAVRDIILPRASGG